MALDSDAPVGKYGSFAELARNEVPDLDYRVRITERPESRLLIVAPHGGLIEDGTSQIAESIAGTDHNLFLFEGLKAYGANRVLHITSHRFDHPGCFALAARCASVISVHGCLGDSRIHVGGLDEGLTAMLAIQLRDASFPIEANSRRYPGRHPLNICNRGATRAGAQLEITYDLRGEKSRAAIARAVRSAIAAHDDHMRRMSEAP